MNNNITLEIAKCERDMWQEIAKSKMTADEFERCCKAVERYVNKYLDIEAEEFENCCEENAYECKAIDRLEEIANA